MYIELISERNVCGYLDLGCTVLSTVMGVQNCKFQSCLPCGFLNHFEQ